MPSTNYSSRQNKTAIEAVIFDYGNVLSLPQSASEVEHMAEKCAMPVRRFHDLYWKFRPAYDRGELNGTSYWTSVTRDERRTPTGDEIAELIALDIRSWLQINPAAMKWAEQLHSVGIPLALLSNMPPEIARHIENNCSWASYFHPRIFSCDLGTAKPDPAIYQSCLESMKLAADKVLFLDDRAENVIAAAQLGIHSLVFDDMGKVLGEIPQLFEMRAPVELDGATTR
jgi:putative hydrolase of the HAD superfamily